MSQGIVAGEELLFSCMRMASEEKEKIGLSFAKKKRGRRKTHIGSLLAKLLRSNFENVLDSRSLFIRNY